VKTTWIALGVFCVLAVSTLAQTNHVTITHTNLIQAAPNLGETSCKMLDKIWELFFTMLGAALATFGGIWAAHFLRRRDAKLDFKIIISIKKGEIPHASYEKTWDSLEFYKRTKPEIRDAISRIEPFLKKNQVVALEKLWREYTTLRQEREMDGGSDGLAAKVEKGPEYPLHNEEILANFLDKFSNAVDEGKNDL
jgi:hypothetical protein